MMDTLTYWWRAVRQFPILTFFTIVSVIAITVIIILMYPREYRSQARLLLRVGHESATLDPTADATGQVVQRQFSLEHDVQTELQVMRSRLLLEAVVDKVGTDLILDGSIGMDNDAPESPGILVNLQEKVRSLDPISVRERAVRKLSANLSFYSELKSSVIDIEYRSKSPAAAQEVLRAWVEAYLANQAEFHRTSGSLSFFQTEERALKGQLDREYERLRKAKTDDGLVTIVGQQELLEGQLAVVRNALVETDSELAGSKSRLESLNRLLEQTEGRTVMDEVSGKSNEATDSMRSKLFELEVLEREYRAKYKSDHPRYLAIKRQLAEARDIVDSQDQMRAEVTSGINPVYQQLQQEVLLATALQDSLTEKRLALMEKREEIQSEVARLNAAEVRVAEIERQVTILEARYAAHSERLEQARIDESLKEQRISSVNEIQPASFEERPTSPNKKLVGAAGLLALIAAAFGMPVLALSTKDHRDFVKRLQDDRNAVDGSEFVEAASEQTRGSGFSDEVSRSFEIVPAGTPSDDSSFREKSVAGKAR